MGEELLTTRIYANRCRGVEYYPVKKRWSAGRASPAADRGQPVAILPPNRRADRRGAGTRPGAWLQRLGNVAQPEMDRVFNCGIGFTMVVAPYFADSIRDQLIKDGVPTYAIGEIRDGEAGVEWVE